MSLHELRSDIKLFKEEAGAFKVLVKLVLLYGIECLIVSNTSLLHP